ncbi:hypothetical protein [Legionella longbeachae]|uniref:hypothetical protein n=1 Tax=Legionella longbeachae TaxID=450 RepID=UPI001CC1E2AD|nr:hypothetical protein [Legionella longbeachae]
MTTFSEQHKNILRSQRKKVLETLDAIAAYLVENGDVESEWRMMLIQEHMINYYEVIPDNGSLRTYEIDLELFVAGENGHAELKLFKKDVLKANDAILRVVANKLNDRKKKLMQMIHGVSNEQFELINAHIEHTESLLKKCYILKISGQLLLTEVAGLHFIDEIFKQSQDSEINSLTHDKYMQFKRNMDDLKELVQMYSPKNAQEDYFLVCTRKDIFEKRQQFNKSFSICKSLLHSFSQDGVMDSGKEQSILASFNNVQHLFFAKCGVFFKILT